MKLLWILYLAFLVTGVTEFFCPIVETYFYDDWEFASFLSVLIAIDTISGVWKHAKMRTIASGFSFFGKIFRKLVSYGFIMILLHIIASFTIHGEEFKTLGFIETYGSAALIVKEGISIFENLGAINPNWIPKWILTKLKEFDNTGKFKAS